MRTAFPYAVGATGRTARATMADHLGQLLEQIVFVEPGERVNRPDFGCMLRGLTFTTGRDEVAAAIGALVHSALRQWANPAVQIRDVSIDVADARVTVTISYLDLTAQTLRQLSVTR